MSNQDMSRRRFLRNLGIAGGGALALPILNACGDSDDSGSSSASDTAPETTAAASTDTTAAAAASAGGLIGLPLNGLNDYTRGVATGAYAALEGTDFELQVVQGNYDPGEELANIDGNHLQRQRLAGNGRPLGRGEGARKGCQRLSACMAQSGQARSNPAQG